MTESPHEPVEASIFGASSNASRASASTAPRHGAADEAGASGDEPEAGGGAGYRFRGYAKEIVDRVWQMAEVVEGNDPAIWRKDEFGAWIHRLDYGNRRSDFGWEVTETHPGSSRIMGIASLRAMHWQNYLDQVAAASQSRITADGLRNVRRLL